MSREKHIGVVHIGESTTDSLEPEKLRDIRQTFQTCNMKYTITGFSIALFIIGCLITLIIYPNLSFVRYNEVAFKKNTFSNDVDESKAYGKGVYFWGFFNSPIAFPATYNVLHFKLGVASKKGLNFDLNCDVYYRLNTTNLPEIFSRLGRAYEPRFRDMIKSAVKNTAVHYTVDEFIHDRVNITRAMRERINLEISHHHLEIESGKFLVQEVSFPDQIKDKFRNTAVQLLQNEQASLQQEIDSVRKVTETMVEEINKNITLVRNEANALYETDVNKAEEIGKTTRQQAVTDGMKKLFDELNINAQTDKDLAKKILEYYTIIENQNMKVIEGNGNYVLNF